MPAETIEVIDAQGTTRLLRALPEPMPRRQKLVTPDDNEDLPDGPCLGLEVIDDGTLVCVAIDDDVAVTREVERGQFILVRIRRVLEDTTASVVALYW